jgi:RNA polymerase primary sigma factor
MSELEKIPETQLRLIEGLVERAREQGFITSTEILEALPEAEAKLDALEDLFFYLDEAGIEVVFDDETEPAVDEVAAVPIEEIAVPERAELEQAFDLEGIAVDDTVSLYLKEMSRVPLLSAEEEIQLAQQMKRGQLASKRVSKDGHDSEEGQRLEDEVNRGAESRAHLIKANTRLVVSIAKKYLGQGVPFLDLIQEGNLGLMKAVEKFDPRRGCKFSTYATWWIRQAITRALAEQGRIIRLPVHMDERLRKVYWTARQLERDNGHSPTTDEIATEMGLKSRKVEWLLRVSRRPVSLEKPVGEEEDSELGDFIEDQDALSPVETTYQHLLGDKLEEVLSTLSPREARILRLRFGLHDGRSYTLKEVGEKFGLTRERIRQIEAEALDRLRHPSRSRQLRGYL